MSSTFFVRNILRQTPNELPSDIAGCNTALAPYTDKGSPAGDVFDRCIKVGEAKLIDAEPARVRSQAEGGARARSHVRGRRHHPRQNHRYHVSAFF